MPDLIESPEKLGNLDILNLLQLADAELIESQECQAAQELETNPHDRKRMADWLGYVKARYTLYQDEPYLDLPHYHPRAVTAPTPPERKECRNRDVSQWNNLVVALRIELAFCDSASRAAGFHEPDKPRFFELIEKMSRFLELVETQPFLDLPDLPE